MRLTTTLFLTLTFFLMSCSCSKELHQEHYSDGTLREEFFTRNGNNIGQYSAYYSDSSVHATGRYLRGKMNGAWQYYYPNGAIQSVQKFRRGKAISINYWDINGDHVIIEGTGTAKTYFPSGKLESIISYQNNVFHGICETWYPNGVKASESHYEKGEPIETWLFWNEKGELINKENY